MSKISVIVPIFNSEKFLEKCLNSIINQSFNNLEIICIDDGSTDKSCKILNKFAEQDRRIKIVCQKNQGPSCARNAGIEIATGEYIAFIDSDDWIDLNFFEKLYSAAKKFDADIAVCSIKRLRSYKWKYHLKIEKEDSWEDANKKFQICDVPEKCYVWNKIYKLSKLKEFNIKFEPNIYYEDRLFTVQALYYLKKLVSVPNTYYNYWTNNKSIVKTKSPKKDLDSKYTYNKMMNFLKQNNINLEHYSNKIKKYKIFGLTCFKTKEFKNKIQFIVFNQIKFSINKNLYKIFF